MCKNVWTCGYFIYPTGYCADKEIQKRQIVERARLVRYASVRSVYSMFGTDHVGIDSSMLSCNEIGLLLDEGMSEEEYGELEKRAEICQRFVSWKMSIQDHVGIKERLREVLEG
jgi:hypothetical protein